MAEHTALIEHAERRIAASMESELEGHRKHVAEAAEAERTAMAERLVRRTLLLFAREVALL